MSLAEIRAQRLTIEGNGGSLIRDLDLRVAGGRSLGITGPSGSGKTALLHALGGLLPAAGGQLLLDGRPAVLWRDASLGLILQNLALVPLLNAQETVALPLQAKGLPKAEVEERSGAALEVLGLADHAAQLVAQLSGGQRQRVAVARALAASPDVILADEPTSALDEHWRQVVLDLLVAEARRGAVVIIASTDRAVIDLCDEVVALGLAHNEIGLEDQVKVVSADSQPTVVNQLRGTTRSRHAPVDVDSPMFADVYRANVSGITAYFARRCRDPQTVADLTSETFVEALGSLSSFDPRRGTPRGWLFGIARIVFARYWAAVESGLQIAERAPRIVLDQDEIEELAARIDDQREGRRLMDKWAALPERERTALELVDLNGLSPREAARALKVSPGVLRARLFRARSRLRKESRNQ